jgi:hypothetical protein
MLRKLWEGWKRVGHAIGNFQARVLLTVFYIVLVAPLGLVVRIFADPMRIRRPMEGWLQKEPQGTDMVTARRQW